MQDKTNFYNGRAGIISIMPDFFEDIDKSCPKWSSNELDIIVKHSIENKVIPSLAYVPEHFLNLTKQVWWLVPLLFGKAILLLWLLIDKNGFYAPFSDHEDGA